MGENNKKFFKYLLIYLLSFAICFGVFFAVNKVSLIPILNNFLIAATILIFISLQIFSFVKLIESRFVRYIKVVFSILIIGLALFSTYLLFIATIFLVKDNHPFIYENKKYYYMNVGWLDPDYRIYKKKCVTMDELNKDEINSIFLNFNEVENEDAKSIIKKLIGIEDKKSSYRNKNIENEKITPNNEQELLNLFSVDDAIKIENSEFALVEVDYAMARSRWFFVRIDSDDLIFISELEDTSPKVCGEVDNDGNIYLEFKDIHGNISSYKSSDEGLTWDKI